MESKIVDALFVVCLPGIVLVVAAAVTMVRNYGLGFLWCLRFQPIRDVVHARIREMHPQAPVDTETNQTVNELPVTAQHVAANRNRSNSIPPHDPFLQA